ncbi:MAG TPA: Amuc_1100 family pilus-like protein [Opitutaceae bacterium]|nr:Amuc_1100 family pilus-like protein [Opitutaceae bacterium]
MSTGFLRRVRAHPVFFAMLATLAGAAIAGAVGVGFGLELWRTEEAKLTQLRIERLTPQARPEMIAAAEAALKAARERLALARAAWPAPTTGGAEVDRLGAYAELVAYVERCRAAAEAAGVTIEPGERFGFSRYAQEAPAAEEVTEVLAQKQVLERVLGALFAAGPERLHGASREATGGSAAERVGAEWCRLEATRSVGVAQLVMTRAVRVTFDADTTCLRRFLNRLACESGFVVREVGAASREDKRSGVTRPDLQAAVRRFSVTLEAVEIAMGGVAQPVVATPSDIGGPWPETSTESVGRERTELFASPRNALAATASGGPGAECGLELLAVRVIPYRWRLVGHVSGVGGDAAVLEETGARRSVVLALGEREPRTGVTLSALAVTRARHGGRLVRAELADPHESKPVVLTTTGENGAARVTATLRVRGRGEPLEIAEGAKVRADDGERTVAAIRTDPAEVELTRDGAPAVRLRVAAR